VSFDPFFQNFKVGYDLISTPKTSLAVESTLAMTKLWLTDNLAATLSKMGARDLQCPHHGA